MTKPPVARKLAVGHLCVRQLVFWLVIVSSFNYFKMHTWSISMQLLLHSAFMLSVVKLMLKGEVGICALISHGNYIVDHGKLWKNHGIVFLNFCGNSVFIAYTFKGQVHVFVGQVKIVSHFSCRTNAIFKYFCPLVSVII